MMKRDGGFTLIEVLVALTILTLSLVTLYQALGSAYGGARRAALQDEAMAVGQALMARVGHDVPLAPAKFKGRLSHGATWRMAIEDITPANAGVLFHRYAVTYEAMTPLGAPLFQMKTFRIARKDQP
ncbi:MAG: type II secretion system GspH family protein [Hyphomicrobiaceae bacterium]|nr:type II secretion system GspH family protein [Hyphomicrobiaceae bacterium]